MRSIKTKQGTIKISCPTILAITSYAVVGLSLTGVGLLSNNVGTVAGGIITLACAPLNYAIFTYSGVEESENIKRR